MEGVRRGAYQLWRVLIALYVVAAVTQFLLAGAGIFGATDNFDPHETLGHIMFFPGGALLLLLALVAWRPRWIWIGTLILVAALFLQIILAGVGEDEPWVGAFHPVNALVVLGLSFHLAQRAWGWPMGRRRDAAAEPGPVAPREAA